MKRFTKTLVAAMMVVARKWMNELLNVRKMKSIRNLIISTIIMISTGLLAQQASGNL